MTSDHAKRPQTFAEWSSDQVADELLSSWLVGHAAYYGVTGSFFAQWLGCSGRATFSALGTIGWVCRRSRAYLKNSAAIQSHSSR